MGADISYLNPENLRFTKASVPMTFDSGTRLESTYQAVLDGSVHIDLLPPLEVVRENLWFTPLGFSPNYWVVDGNRRLYLYRKLKVLGAVSTVRAHVQEYGGERGPPHEAFGTRNDGQAVAVMGDAGLTDRINSMGITWQETKEARERTIYRVLVYGAIACGALTIITTIVRSGRLTGQ